MLRAAVQGEDPDVVCVTDAPRWLRWRSRSAALAREAGLLVVAGTGPSPARLLLAPLRTKVLAVTVADGVAVALVEARGERAAVATGPGPSPYDAPLVVCE